MCICRLKKQFWSKIDTHFDVETHEWVYCTNCTWSETGLKSQVDITNNGLLTCNGINHIEKSSLVKRAKYVTVKLDIGPQDNRDILRHWSTGQGHSATWFRRQESAWVATRRSADVTWYPWRWAARHVCLCVCVSVCLSDRLFSPCDGQRLWLMTCTHVVVT